MADRHNIIPGYPPIPTTTASSPVSPSNSLNSPVAGQRLRPVVHQNEQNRNIQAREQTTISPSVAAVSPVSPISPNLRDLFIQGTNIHSVPVPNHVAQINTGALYPFAYYAPSQRIQPDQYPHTHPDGRHPNNGLHRTQRPLPSNRSVISSLDSNIRSFQSDPNIIKNQQNATSRRNTLLPGPMRRQQVTRPAARPAIQNPHPVIHHPPPTDLTRKRPGSPPSPLKIVMVTPGSPTPFREKRVRTKAEEEVQREDSRRLKEHGGACVWCYVNKKKCSTESPCRPCDTNKRMCFRDGSELWLCPPTADQPKKNFQRAKENVFGQVNQIFHRLQSLWSPQPGATIAFAEILQNDSQQLPLLASDISRLNINDVRTQNLKEGVVSASQLNITLSGLEKLDADAVQLPLVDSAVGVLKLFAAIAAVSRSFVYFRPVELQAARAAMFFILALHAQALCEKSEGFCSQLCDTLRRKESHEQHRGEPCPTDPVNPIWVALGLYYRVLLHLTTFEPGASISQIFHGIKSQAEVIIPNVRQLLLKHIHYKAKSSILKSSSLDVRFLESVPEIPESNHFEIAFSMKSENQFPVSTALARQEKPFDNSLRYPISSILDEDFTIDIDPRKLTNHGDGSQSSQYPLHSGVRLDGQETTAWDSPLSPNVSSEQDLCPTQNETSSSSDQQTGDSIFTDEFTIDNFTMFTEEFGRDGGSLWYPNC